MLTNLESELLNDADFDPRNIKSETVNCLSNGPQARVTRVEQWVLKTSDTSDANLRFNAEISGLKQLAQKGLKTPEVIKANATGFVMPFYQPCENTPKLDAKLGEQLAALHRDKASRYASPFPGYLSRIPLPQIPPSTDWQKTFFQTRLLPIFDLAKDRDARVGQLNLRRSASMPLYSEGPCVIHGDLWAGNILMTETGPIFIDPSVWIGERGMDLAMLTLFGKPSTEFWSAYESYYPVPMPLRQTLVLYQLFFALAHVALFGPTYFDLCDRLYSQHLSQRPATL